MSPQVLSFVPIGNVVVMEDGVPSLMRYLDDIDWHPPSSARAFLVVRFAPLGDPAAGYYLFRPDHFAYLAGIAARWPARQRTEYKLADLFDIHETTARAVSEDSDDPGVVVENGRVTGVRIEENRAVRPATDGRRPSGPPPAPASYAPPAYAPPPPPAADTDWEGPVAYAPPPAPGADSDDWWDAEEDDIDDEPTEAEPTEAEPPPPAASDVIRRTPHLDAPETISPGDALTVTVYADAGPAQPGEDSAPFELHVDAAIQEVTLDVWLATSSHLEVLDPKVAQIVVRRNTDRSTAATFRLQAKTAAPPRTRASVTALFVYDGRPAGSVRRDIAIGPASVAARAGTNPPAPVLRVDATASRPDLLVEVRATDDNDGRRYLCRVTSHLLPDLDAAPAKPWNLPDVSSTLVASYLSQFTRSGVSNEQRRASLVGAGKQLFAAAPANFRDALWRLVDAGTVPASLFVVSQESYVPWELMVPHRTRPDGSYEQRQPLGVELAVGRWVSNDHRSPTQQLPAGDAWVVAPQYAGAKALAHAAEEAALLTQLFNATALTPVRYANVATMLGGAGVRLVHFICHGHAATAGNGGVQTVDLDPDDTLSSLDLAGMGIEAAFAASEPMVFLNACEVGRLEPALVGVQGFASAFIDLGARCVIAPLWSVEDSVAHEVATDFYNEMKADPAKSLAEIVRGIRAKAYEGQGGPDTYAAYAFYGDPATAGTPG